VDKTKLASFLKNVFIASELEDYWEERQLIVPLVGYTNDGAHVCLGCSLLSLDLPPSANVILSLTAVFIVLVRCDRLSLFPQIYLILLTRNMVLDATPAMKGGDHGCAPFPQLKFMLHNSRPRG
jgi:hypothetical protein